MQKSRFIEPKGFVFSLDAAISVVLIVSAIFLFIAVSFETQFPFESSLQAGNDAVTAMNRTGYLSETFDSNTLSEASTNIRQKMLELIPNNLDARVELKKYDLNTATCRAGQDFESCFLQTAPETAAAGPLVPQKEVFFAKKVLVLGEDTTQCDLNVALRGQTELAREGIAFFSEKKSKTAYFQEEENPLGIDFNVSVDPPDAITCDQDIKVTLTITLPPSVRSPIDMMLVLDRSGSMSWNGRVDTTDATGIWVFGNTAYIADGSAGVRSIDISTPLIPTRIDRYDPGTIIDVYGQGDYVFIADIRRTDELISINATNPSNLVEVDNLNFDFIRGVFVDSNYAYVAGERRNANDSGLVIVDITNPDNIVRVGNIDTTDPNDAFALGDYVYFADGSAGFKVIDVSDKSAPLLVDSVNTSGDAVGVFVDGNYAYVADGARGLVVIDIRDPASVFITDTIDTPGFAYNVFVDGNYAYVADRSSLQGVNITDKFNLFVERVYNTPYAYNDVFVQNDLGFIAADYIGMIVLDLVNGERIVNAKNAAKSFVDFNGWTMPPDQIGLSSFNTSATLDQSLTSNKADLNTAIDSLIASGGTNIESGIDSANTELTGPNANAEALKFEVLLSDGQSNSGDSADAAQDAADNNITIFTIGFGADADEAELTTIANITGGQYYSATDENALQAIFNIIAAEIAQRASDINVFVPFIGGALVIDPGSGTLVDGNLVFDIGELTAGEPWSTTYILNFPCISVENCDTAAISLPGEGAQLTYIDTNGVSHTIDFNAQVTLDFYKRDLSVDIVSGTAVSSSEVYLDVVVENIAQLDANSVDLNFFLNDLNGQFLTSVTVPPLCSTETPGCTDWITTFNSLFIPSTGKIYATIGDGTEIRECPLRNTDVIFCGTGTPIKFIEIKYFMWRK